MSGLKQWEYIIIEYFDTTTSRTIRGRDHASFTICEIGFKRLPIRRSYSSCYKNPVEFIHSLRHRKPSYQTKFLSYAYMSNKKETEEPGLTTEEAKELELNEQPKPTRKTSHHSPPMSYNEEPGRHHKRKGTRKIK